MAQRIGGKDFHILFMGVMIKVVSASISIDDGREVATTNGVPNGFVDGPVSGSGELELDQQNFDLMVAGAKRAGSWKGIDPFDVMFFAATNSNRRKVEAFDCLPKISDLLNIDSKGGEKSTTKVPFDVTGPDFIRIDGVPYLTLEETASIY